MDSHRLNSASSSLAEPGDGIVINIKKLGDGIYCWITAGIKIDLAKFCYAWKTVHGLEELCPSMVRKLQHGNIGRGYRLVDWLFLSYG